MFLDEYSNIQPVAYKTLIQAIKNNKISHAYIFETNNNTDNLKEFDCTTGAGNITLKNCLFENKNNHRTFDSSFTNVDASSYATCFV